MEQREVLQDSGPPWEEETHQVFAGVGLQLQRGPPRTAQKGAFPITPVGSGGGGLQAALTNWKWLLIIF